jgi:FkbM family methyltransferase
MSEYIIKTKGGMPNKKFLFCIDDSITESKCWYDVGGSDHEGYKDSISLELIYNYLLYIYDLDIDYITSLNPQQCIELYSKLVNDKIDMHKFDVILDIGSHHGQCSINFSEIGTQVIAIEPFLINFNILKKNIELNALTNVSCLNNYVSSKSEILKFDKKDWIKFNNDVIHKIDSFFVVSITIDQLYNTITPNSLIKIDAEGEEIQILKGSTKVIADKIPNFIIELHDFSSDNHDELTNLIDFSKYEIVKLNRQDAQLRKYHTGDKFSDINWLFFRKI